jgi:hypothetical protein
VRATSALARGTAGAIGLLLLVVPASWAWTAASYGGVRWDWSAGGASGSCANGVCVALVGPWTLASYLLLGLAGASAAWGALRASPRALRVAWAAQVFASVAVVAMSLAPFANLGDEGVLGWLRHDPSLRSAMARLALLLLTLAALLGLSGWTLARMRS